MRVNVMLHKVVISAAVDPGFKLEFQLSHKIFMKEFLRSLSLFSWLDNGSCRLLPKYVCQVLVNHLEN